MSELQKILLAAVATVAAFMLLYKRSSSPRSVPQVGIGQIQSSIEQPDSQFPFLIAAIEELFTQHADENSDENALSAVELCNARGGTLARLGDTFRCSGIRCSWDSRIQTSVCEPYTIFEI